jgi:DNA mismatch repair protein MutL
VPAAAGYRAGNGGAQGRGDWIFADAPPSRPSEASLPGLEAPSTQAGADGRLRFADLRLLGQLLATYLVLEGKEGLLLLDQHAAHERVLYEGLRAEWQHGGVASQGLLAPLTVSLAPAPLRALGEAGPAVAALGFDVEVFGEDAVVLRAVPALLAERDPVLVLRDLADELAAAPVPEEALAPGTRALEASSRLFASLACHSARRKGDHLDLREQETLLNALDAIPWAPTCPHGRPLAAPFELAEIERRFGRR